MLRVQLIASHELPDHFKKYATACIWILAAYIDHVAIAVLRRDSVIIVHASINKNSMRPIQALKEGKQIIY